jgi:hypothetical protein
VVPPPNGCRKGIEPAQNSFSNLEKLVLKLSVPAVSSAVQVRARSWNSLLVWWHGLPWEGKRLRFLLTLHSYYHLLVSQQEVRSIGFSPWRMNG